MTLPFTGDMEATLEHSLQRVHWSLLDLAVGPVARWSVLLVPVGMAAVTSLHLGAQPLSPQDVRRACCRLAQGVSTGPQPESGGTRRGGLPSIRTFSGLLDSVLSDLRGTG